ncbi:QueT transporter family protein [Ruminococcaceae bacterium OttesenSCG-928-L11]|nr:QueT transporter family protein [Ruminococcaceae bacterium OttesenSCG-928-L11]
MKLSTRNLVVCAMIAALYTAICMALMPLSYGMVQIRAAEALTLLPVFSPVAIWGVTLGCAVSNLVGLFTGANPLILDAVFGTLATLIAAVLSYLARNVRVKGIPVLSAVPPVIVNALIIGLEITYLEAGGFHPQMFLLNALYVGAGQAVSCFGLGLPLVYLLQKTGVANKCFAGLVF